MPPRRVVVAPATRRAPPRGFLGTTWATLTDPENASTLKAVATFGAAVAFLSSSWSELLLPA
ncbi:hypothetical protein KEM56_007068 [Ascosphaera pollenicola]|nr:hypothetical protein KEM56_007068 [Ascosphaera pollenicola]